MSSSTIHRQRQIAVIGAGPIGMEAALAGVRAGFDVQVYERGRVAENLLDWGHVRLFSPFELNTSPWGRAALASSGRPQLPAGETLQTGREFVETYLLPLSRLPMLCDRIHEHVRVEAVGRAGAWKGELIAKPQRDRHPFRLLLADGRRQWHVEADFVFDCSGVYPNASHLGAGGLPALGEARSLDSRNYRLPDIIGRDRAHFAGKTTLIVGSGYSAATAVVALARLAESELQTRGLWLTRTARTPPITRIPGDRLPERDRLAEAANRIALADDGPLDWRPARLIQSIQRTGQGGAYRVGLEDATGPGRETHTIVVDRIIAHTGYRPDMELCRELQVHHCYASEGTMKLAAALLGETSADCLAQAGHGAETLRNPEPGCFILGSKSYGRNSRFLLRIGIQQIEDVFSLLEGLPGPGHAGLNDPCQQ